MFWIISKGILVAFFGRKTVDSHFVHGRRVRMGWYGQKIYFRFDKYPFQTRIDLIDGRKPSRFFVIHLHRWLNDIDFIQLIDPIFPKKGIYWRSQTKSISFSVPWNTEWNWLNGLWYTRRQPLCLKRPQSITCKTAWTERPKEQFEINELMKIFSNRISGSSIKLMSNDNIDDKFKCIIARSVSVRKYSEFWTFISFHVPGSCIMFDSIKCN